MPMDAIMSISMPNTLDFLPKLFTHQLILIS